MLRAHKTRIRNANPGSSIARALATARRSDQVGYNALLARLNEATQASPSGALWPSVDDLAKTLRREKPEWWATVPACAVSRRIGPGAAGASAAHWSIARARRP